MISPKLITLHELELSNCIHVGAQRPPNESMINSTLQNELCASSFISVIGINIFLGTCVRQAFNTACDVKMRFLITALIRA